MFLLLSNKITADGDCSHEIKRGLLLGRKAITNLDSRLKCRDITFLTKVHLVKAMVFPVVMYGCESRAIKKPECQNTGSTKKTYDQARQHSKNQRHYFANKGPSSQSYDFSSSHV